jgi:hypothetical protein
MGHGLDAALLLGAIAFAGAGGSLNLGQSSYVMDKGYGMGNRAGRLTSPLRGDETETVATSWVFPLTPENLARWRVWWKRASLEHLLTFFAACVICLVVLALIAYCVFFEPDGTRAVAVEGAGHDLSFLRTEAGIIKERMGGALSLAFLVAGVAILLTTELGVLDAASRISTDLVGSLCPRRSAVFTRSRLYFAFLWGTILLSCVLLVLGTEKLGALSLFRYTAAMNGGVMFLYTGLLLYLNRCRLPREVRTSTWRAVILLVSIAFYGFFAVWAVVSVVGG